MNNAPSPTPSVTRSRRRGERSPQAELPDELNHWVGDFGRHLSQVVGLTPASRRQYRFFVRRFLAQYRPATAHDEWAPRAEWLTAFVRQEAVAFTDTRARSQELRCMRGSTMDHFE